MDEVGFSCYGLLDEFGETGQVSKEPKNSFEHFDFILSKFGILLLE